MQARKEPSPTGAMWGYAVLGGLVLAAIDSSFSGFIIGAVLGIVWAQVRFLRQQQRELQRQIDALRADAAPAKAVSTLSEHASTVERPTTARTEAPAPIASPPSVPPNPNTAPQPATARVAIKREPDLFDRALAFAVAWLKGGNPLARIGIVVLFFGAAFLAKYAADHSLFPIELRFMALAAGALALVVVGWRLRHKRAGYAEILQGGGIAGLYLTVFAAASLFKLLPLGLAFGLMVCIALAAAVLAVAQNALSLAVIGTAGGFLAPILVSTGSGNHIALFSYYAILNLGIFAVAWYRTWRVLNVLGFVFTFTITGLWRASGYTPDELLSADLFLILFFLMYVGVSILNCIRQPPNLKGYVSGSLVFGLPVVAFTLHATLVARIEYAMAWSALATGAFYLALAYALLRARRDSFRLLIEAFAALGVIFASLAIPLAFDTRTTAAMWSVEGAGLVWLGLRQDRKLARAFGALLQVAGGIGYLLGIEQRADALPVLNSAALGAVMLALSGLYTSFVLHRQRSRLAVYERGASAGFALWGVAWWLFGGLIEIERLSSDGLLGLGLIYVALTAFALTLSGAQLAWPFVRRMTLFLPAAAIAFALPLVAIEPGHPFGRLVLGGAAGWLALFAVFYWMLHRAERESLPMPLTRVLHVGAAWLLVLVLTWESAWQVDRYAAGVWPTLPWGVLPAIAIALLSRRVPWPAWPVAQHLSSYRVIVAAPLAAFVSLWILLTNATNHGDPVWLPYVPLLNPLDIDVAIGLVSGALWWSALDATQRRQVWPGDPRVLLAVIAGLVFFWLNAALIRALHHNFGAPITLYGIARSQFVQAALSIFWALLGFIAMTLAARKHWRYVWMVGAGLMLVVVAKLFLVDLSNVGTIARIVSFLTIGALIVVTGYVAPLPPKRESSEPPASSEDTVIS